MRHILSQTVFARNGENARKRGDVRAVSHGNARNHWPSGWRVGVLDSRLARTRGQRVTPRSRGPRGPRAGATAGVPRGGDVAASGAAGKLAERTRCATAAASSAGAGDGWTSRSATGRSAACWRACISAAIARTCCWASSSAPACSKGCCRRRRGRAVPRAAGTATSMRHRPTPARRQRRDPVLELAHRATAGRAQAVDALRRRRRRPAAQRELRRAGGPAIAR